MSETNGWPGKPGTPLNPEKDGWHWVVSFDAEKTIVFWHGENQGNEGYWEGYPLWIAQDWTYLGPCLTPDEATALQARVAELERLAGLADSWITAALECKDWHWDADQHEAATHTRDELRAALEGKKE